MNTLECGEDQLETDLQDALNALFDIAASLPPATGVKLAQGIQNLNHFHMARQLHIRRDALSQLTEHSASLQRSGKHIEQLRAAYADELRKRKLAETLSGRLLMFARTSLTRTPETLQAHHESLGEWMQAWFRERYGSALAD